LLAKGMESLLYGVDTLDLCGFTVAAAVVAMAMATLGA
jgi:hypothetical protein